MKRSEGFGFEGAEGGCSRRGMNETLKKELKKLLGAKDDGFGVSRTSAPSGWRRKLSGAGWIEDVEGQEWIFDGVGSIAIGCIAVFARGDDRISVTDIYTSARKSFSVRSISRG